MSKMKYSRASRSGTYVSDLGPTSPTPVHNAASTDAQTCCGRLQSSEVGDGTASRVAGVRLKKKRGSSLRCVITGHSDIHFFLFGPVKPLGEPRVLVEEKLEQMQ